MHSNPSLVVQCFDSEDGGRGDMKPNENRKHIVCRQCSAALRKRKLRLHELIERLNVFDNNLDCFLSYNELKSIYLPICSDVIIHSGFIGVHEQVRRCSDPKHLQITLKLFVFLSHTLDAWLFFFIIHHFIIKCVHWEYIRSFKCVRLRCCLV